MTRITIRHTLSVFAAVALVFAFTSGSALAENKRVALAQIQAQQFQNQVVKKAPKGLATKKRPPKPIVVLQFLF